MQPNKQRDDFQGLDTQPIYNIKAVVEATGLPAATLRAWERRYGALVPRRTESGYRLYSARDVAVLRWLKARVEEGMSISQAIALLSLKRKAESAHALHEQKPETRQGLVGARTTLVKVLLGFDETRADRLLEEAFVIYGVEAVIEHIIVPAIAEIGEQWHQGLIAVAVEHFASNYLRRKLEALINASPKIGNYPPVVMGCAPNDWHEMALLSLYLLLRRKGVNAIYLGQNVPVEQFIEEMARLRPALVIISAATSQVVPGLIELARAVESMPPPRPLFTYGGSVFNTQPDLRQSVPGIFLGESVRAAAEYVVALIEPFVTAANPEATPAPGASRPDNCAGAGC
ncbi:MAG: MerR family transcriptional regulator [Anaerolineae bacterium]